jgi:DNA-directed RNA polymerase subunit E"
VSKRSKTSTRFRACKLCKALVPPGLEKCLVCGSTQLSDEWEGLIIVFDLEKSSAAHLVGVERPYRFALVVK